MIFGHDHKPSQEITPTYSLKKGLVEGHLIRLYGKAGLTNELHELAESLKDHTGESLNLAVADAWVKAWRLSNQPATLHQVEQAVAAIPEAYWRFELWLNLHKATREAGK